MVQDIGDRRADTVLLAGQQVDRATVQGLKTASARSGVSFQYLLAKASQESSLNPTAQADTSSAAGLFQFTRGTWLDMLKRYGSQYGYGDLARQILETPSGKLTIADDAAEQRILALRQNPEASALMAAEYARDNASALKDSLGRAPDTAELYLAHFLGPSGAASLLNGADDTPTRSAASLVPAAAKSNPGVFATADGHARSAADVVKLMRDRFDGQMRRYADAGTTATDAAPARAVDYQPTRASSAGTLGKLDLRTALGGLGERASPASQMMLDQLIHIITADPMATDESDSDDQDPIRPLSTGGLKGSDWADAMSRAMSNARPAAPGRVYSEGDPKPRAVDDLV